jgi:opacity protein-like surface antigen
MEKKLLVVLVVVGLCSTAALALDPMGPPTAGLKQGQFGGSLEYSYSNMDLAIDGCKLKDVKMNKGYANLGYGIADNWEASIRLGGADAGFKDEDDGFKYNGDIGFAYGFGTKATLYQQSPELKWGGLFQMSWADLSGTAKEIGGTGKEGVDLNAREIQIGVGLTWIPSKGLSVYGGPFVHFLHADWNGGANTGSADLTEANSFGGWIGAEVEVAENLPVCVEWQYTGTDNALGVSAVCRF